MLSTFEVNCIKDDEVLSFDVFLRLWNLHHLADWPVLVFGQQKAADWW